LYTDGFRKDERVACAIVTPECKIRKRMRSQNTIYGAEQEAIIKAIGTTRKSNKKRIILIDSLSTLIVIEGNGDTKNPETRILRKMLDEEGEKESLVWVPSHKGITGNEMADKDAKTALEDDIHPTETYIPQDLAKYPTIEAIESRNLKWK
jgi:ribonuclease HI